MRTTRESSPRLRANLFRPIETRVHELERDRRFEFARKHLRSYDEVRGPLRSTPIACSWTSFRECTAEQEAVETVTMLAEPEEQGMDDHESNASTDVAQDHMRDPELNGSNHLWELLWKHLRNECRASSLFSCCGVRLRPSLGSLLMEFGGVFFFFKADPQMCRCFTRQPENSKRAHFRVLALQTPPRGQNECQLWR